MIKNSNYVFQKTITNFDKRQFKPDQTKENRKSQKTWKNSLLWAQNPLKITS